VNGDFYKIDAMLFSPAQVTVSNVETGKSFHAGKLAPEIVDASFA
jgi:methenyltetrahydromethanopterin cyclohydrolase